jgi:hypothetical protein
MEFFKFQNIEVPVDTCGVLKGGEDKITQAGLY